MPAEKGFFLKGAKINGLTPNEGLLKLVGEKNEYYCYMNAVLLDYTKCLDIYGEEDRRFHTHVVSASSEVPNLCPLPDDDQYFLALRKSAKKFAIAFQVGKNLIKLERADTEKKEKSYC